MSASAESPRYFAFISYSHRDQRWADWLHKALETYRVPSRLVGQSTTAGTIPRRIAPVFRDRDELASSSDLGRTVNAALAQSRNLIVICSPASAQSRWVNEEVLAFKRLGRSERIFCCIVDGEPNTTTLPGREAEECFAPALRFTIDASGESTSERTEPIAADAREGKDGRGNAKLKLIAGMLDVGFDALKQRELQRRNRRMAIVTAAALVIMAVTTTLAITAVIARNDAERRQKQAEDLVNFMLGDLSDKLGQVNRLDIIESVDDKAMEYFKSLPTSDVTDESLAQRAKALQRIGTVRLDQGHLPAALESYEAALKLISTQASAAPREIGRQVAHAENVSFIGMAHWFQGNLDAAARDFTSATAILERAEQIDGTNTELLRQKKIAESNLGHVRESQGDLEAAFASYRTALDLAERLVAAKPDNVDYVALLGSAHNDLGKLALIRGDLVTAVAEYSADDKIETDLSARDPTNNDQRENVFRVRAIFGRTLALVGDTEGAIRRLREAVDIAAQLEKQDPTITFIRENGALYKMQLGRLLHVSGHIDEATKLTNEALDTLGELVHQDASNTSWQRKLAETRTERAAQLLSSGNTQEASKLLESALAWLEPALENRPNDRDTVLATVNARLLLAAVDEGTSARKLFEAGLESVNGVKSGADDPRLLALKVYALLGLGKTSEALPVIERLRTSGYQDPAFVEAMRRNNIAFLPAKQRGAVAPEEATGKGVSGN